MIVTAVPFGLSQPQTEAAVMRKEHVPEGCACWCMFFLLLLLPSPACSVLLVGTHRRMALPDALISHRRLGVPAEGICTEKCVRDRGCLTFSVVPSAETGKLDCVFSKSAVDETKLLSSDQAFTHYIMEERKALTKKNVTTLKPEPTTHTTTNDTITTAAVAGTTTIAAATPTPAAEANTSSTVADSTNSETTTSVASTSTASVSNLVRQVFLTSETTTDGTLTNQEAVCGRAGGTVGLLKSQAMFDQLIADFGDDIETWKVWLSLTERLDNSLRWPDDTSFSSTDVTLRVEKDTGMCTTFQHSTDFLIKESRCSSWTGRRVVCCLTPGWISA
ncbi:uncharacterized protein LOC125030490 [Penaeus chinensis]|uniref:uncharacterized protein LOC125030490 n=1 Tax=Penaeus chinensis TaxID=139456 RepID=UPI001FB80D3A|nr:uncharacterized protein LOC125030490 [Penaeus chinensis]